MGRPVKTYEDWLALSDKERHEVHFHDWNVYARDGIAIPYMAATRLALKSTRRILDIQIGTYHGGEYLLHLTVREEDFKGCPPMLADSFEGFRVVWCSARMFQAAPEVQGDLQGIWRAEQGDYEFKFVWTEGGVDVMGRVSETGEELQIERPIVNRQYVLFSAYQASLDESTQHVFVLVAPDRCGDSTTRTEYYVRADSKG
jgi:hypothetical protein